MPDCEPTKVLAPESYAELRRRVESVLLTGQREIEAAKVRTYWEAGRLIDAHVLQQGECADLGAETMFRLSEDIGVSYTVLYRCVKFARAFRVLAARPKLSWAHYRLLMLVDSVPERAALETAAVREVWTSRQLEERVRPLQHGEAELPAGVQAGGPRSAGLIPRRGTPGVHRLVLGAQSLAIDLGFTSYLELTADQAEGLSQGACVRLTANGRVVAEPEAKPADLFAYRADALRTIDGDTIWFRIHLGPRHWLKEKLRLRGIDCPELDTPAGKAAKRFVEVSLAQAVSVVIATTKPDKYDRYLADVFLTTAAGDEIFLNNALLENGHAVRKESYALQDWEEGQGGVPG